MSGERGPGIGDQGSGIGDQGPRPRVIVISERDNVATALEALSPGQTIDVSDGRVVVREAIANGHKIALIRIACGQPVLKYGSPIGTATIDIEAGAHVHVHNVASERGRGDRSGDPKNEQNQKNKQEIRRSGED